MGDHVRDASAAAAPGVAVAQTAPPTSFRRPIARAARWWRREEAVMGTAITVELWADAVTGPAACAAVIEEMHRIDRAMSPHKPESELSRINRDAHRAPVALSDEMFALLQRAIGFSEFSQGAFDITYAAIGRLYDYHAHMRPSEEALARARECVGWRKLLLDASSRSLRFAHEGVCIDLGGFAKGHAVDRAAALLASMGVAHATVSAGGDSRVIGDRRGRPWHIGIRDPRREGEMVAVLPLADVAISTSGDYERYFEAGGQRFHHLIDPATGRSPDGVRSVTVIAADALTSEALSKTVFVLGPERGLRLVESVPFADAVAVDALGALHFSAGLRRQ